MRQKQDYNLRKVASYLLQTDHVWSFNNICVCLFQNLCLSIMHDLEIDWTIGKFIGLKFQSDECHTQISLTINRSSCQFFF